MNCRQAHAPVIWSLVIAALSVVSALGCAAPTEGLTDEAPLTTAAPEIEPQPMSPGAKFPTVIPEGATCTAKMLNTQKSVLRFKPGAWDGEYSVDGGFSYVHETEIEIHRQLYARRIDDRSLEVFVRSDFDFGENKIGLIRPAAVNGKTILVYDDISGGSNGSPTSKGIVPMRCDFIDG